MTKFYKTCTIILISFFIGGVIGAIITGSRYDKKIAKIQAANHIYQQNFQNCDSAITIQNEYIERVRVDTVEIVRTLERVRDKYTILRDTVRVQLEEDSSDEKKLEVIDDLLHNFLNDRMRAQGPDEN